MVILNIHIFSKPPFIIPLGSFRRLWSGWNVFNELCCVVLCCGFRLLWPDCSRRWGLVHDSFFQSLLANLNLNQNVQTLSFWCLFFLHKGAIWGSADDIGTLTLKLFFDLPPRLLLPRRLSVGGGTMPVAQQRRRPSSCFHLGGKI